MAYILLLEVKGAKNKYDDEEVNLYTMFHSKVKNTCEYMVRILSSAL